MTAKRSQYGTVSQHFGCASVTHTAYPQISVLKLVFGVVGLQLPKHRLCTEFKVANLLQK